MLGLKEKLNSFIPGLKKHALLFALVALFGLLTPHLSHAMFGIEDIAFLAVSKVLYGVSWLISMLLGVVIAFEGWTLGIILQLNSTVATSAMVQIGFPISLSVANLGFVLAIIIIAYATMFNSGSYGIKQMLWKVVLMAILVNFGLVFAKAMLELPQSLTQYFADAINPNTSQGGWTGFADTFAGAFNPQKSFLTKDLLDVDKNITGFDTSAPEAAASVSRWIGPFLGVVFTVFSLLITMLSLGLVVATLVIRYIIMSILLVMLPLAWITWILPGMKKFGWSSWWDKFIKWAFYPPIILFFLYLAIASMRVMSQNGGPLDNKVLSQPTYNGTTAAGTFLGSVANDVIVQFMQVIVMGALVVGGIFAASSLQISLASGAKGLVTGAGNKVKGWAKTKAQNVQRRTADRVKNIGLQKIKNPNTGQFESTTLGQRLGAKMQKVPGMSQVGASLAKGSTVNRQKEIEEAKKKYGALTAEGLVDAYKRASDPVDKAALGQLIANKNWSKADDKWKDNVGLEGIIKESAQVSATIGDAKGAYGAHPELAEASIEERVMSGSFKDYVDSKGKKADQLSHEEIVSFLAEIEKGNPDLHKKIESEAKLEAVKKTARSIKVSDVPNMSYEAFGGFLPKDVPHASNLAIVSSMSQPMLGKVPDGDNRSIMAILNTIDKAIEAERIAMIKDEASYDAEVKNINDKIAKLKAENKESESSDQAEYLSIIERYRKGDKAITDMYRGLKSNARYLTSGKAFTWPEFEPEQKERFTRFFEGEKKEAEAKRHPTSIME